MFPNTPLLFPLSLLIWTQFQIYREVKRIIQGILIYPRSFRFNILPQWLYPSFPFARACECTNTHYYAYILYMLYLFKVFFSEPFENKFETWCSFTLCILKYSQLCSNVTYMLLKTNMLGGIMLKNFISGM